MERQKFIGLRINAGQGSIKTTKMSKDLKQISKFMSLVLRHQPASIGLSPDANGWVKLADLITQMNKKGFGVTTAIIQTIVDTNDKKRFALSADGNSIRASQGHSIEVELDLVAQTPPDKLYHGTVSKFMDAIRENGLQKMSRQHVHLSATIETATVVAARRGKPIILQVNAAAMQAAGYLFYCSANGVWLTDQVPPQYLTI
jgi:putative RNA 2'-phosphotransferase